MQVAVIGFGYWGKNLIRNFHELDVLHTVCDCDLSRRAILEERFPNVKFEPDFEKVLSDREVDAVAIATPAATHFALAERALAAGKDVFVEKPLALAVDQGEALVRLAAERGRILMVGHILQYHPAVNRLQELVQNGELGKIDYIYSNRLNIGKFRTEENILWSFAPHDISVLLSLIDEQPMEVICRGGDYLSEGVADVTMTHLTFPSGTQAHLFVSWLHPFKEQRLIVVGSKKMAVFDDSDENKLKLYPHSVKWVKQVPTAIKAPADIVDIGDTEPLKAECQQFLDSIASRTPPRTDGREGVRVLGVLAACEASLNSERKGIRCDHDVLGRTSSSMNLVASPGQRNSVYSHETATIDQDCEIGEGTKVWHYSHVMQRATIGKYCSIGQNCCISPDVVIGDNVKIQNNVSVYSGAEIENDVFLGPSCVLTNVSNPRSQVNRQSLYERTLIRQGATVGANATVVCGIEIGRYAFIAAGAVVTKNVADYALMLGNPAKQRGWMSRHGHRLENADADGIMTCPESGLRYCISNNGRLACLDLDEKAALPNHLSKGFGDYARYRAARAQS